MEINKEAILNKTHYGLNIYAYVLRQYYPEIVLSLKGRDCGITRNLFNGRKRTLQINIVDYVDRHYDTELTDFKGDIFDFASYHFKTLKEQDLLIKLNEELHLRIGQKYGIYNQEEVVFTKPKPEIIKQNPPVFSYYKNTITNVTPTKEINLIEVYNIIQGNESATS